MPFATAADGTRIAYTLDGHRDAEPLLMIHGLGADTRGWIMQKRALASRFRLVMVDNRGVGRSGRPAGPYPIEVMADDAIRVLEHAGYGSAHVIGASMGGIISQAIAVLHPDRVRSLVLACTAARHFEWRIDLLTDWAHEAEAYGMREFVRRNIQWMVGPRSLKRLWPAMAVLAPLAFNVPVESFVAQIEGIVDMDDALRTELVNIDIPTLVTVGSQDRLTTQGDSEEIASLIPGAKLVVVRGGAHLFMVEQASTFNRTITEFYDDLLARPLARPRAHTSRTLADIQDAAAR
jgi:pimeloyl-ACP methyl ester carboxylesterase